MTDINQLVMFNLEDKGPLGGEMFNSWSQYPSQQYDHGNQNQISGRHAGDKVVDPSGTNSDYATHKSIESYQKPPASDEKQEHVKREGGSDKNYDFDVALQHAITSAPKRKETPVVKSPNVDL